LFKNVSLSFVLCFCFVRRHKVSRDVANEASDKETFLYLLSGAHTDLHGNPYVLQMMQTYACLVHLTAALVTACQSDDLCFFSQTTRNSEPWFLQPELRALSG